MECYNIELYHHGIKGQRWGFRRYQNPDGSLTPEGRRRYGILAEERVKKFGDRTDLTRKREIPAGTKMYRTSINPNESMTGSTYVSYMQPERNLYKAGWVRETGNADKAYEYSFTLTKDLKVPSRDEQTKAVLQSLQENDKKVFTNTFEKYLKLLRGEQDFEDELEANMEYYGIKERAEGIEQWAISNITWKFNNLSDADKAKYNIGDITACYALKTLGINEDLKKRVIDKLAAQGYNSMVDEASVGGTFGWDKEGYDPLILFDKSVLKIDDIKEISKADENKAYEEYSKWRTKIGKKKAVVWSDTYSDELYHHGIKGQRWGFRRYQNPDGSLTPEGRERYGVLAKERVEDFGDRTGLTSKREIPAGTKMYRTSTNPNENNSGSTYVTYMEPERNLYKGGYIRETGNARKAYEYSYTLTKDLKVPSRAEQTNAVLQALTEEDKTGFVSTFEKYFTKTKGAKSFEDDLAYGMKNLGITDRKSAIYEYSIAMLSKEFYYLSNEEKAKYSFDDLIASYALKTLGINEDLKKRVIDKLAAQGYNSMVDEASVGGLFNYTKEGYDPLIIFDKSVLKVDDVEEISRFEENKAYGDYTKWKKKINRTNSVVWSDTYSDELYHHGVKGQRWGVRRYQNYDGTLTAAGKRRVAQNYRALKKVESKIEKNNAKKDSIRKQTNSIILNKQKSDIEREQNMLLNTQVWLDPKTKDPEGPKKPKGPNIFKSASSFVLKNIIQPEITKYGKAFVGETIDATLKKALNDETYKNIRDSIAGVFRERDAIDAKAQEMSKIYNLVYDYLYNRPNNQNGNYTNSNNK